MPDTERRIRPFADFLQEQRGGACHAELSEALNELLVAVEETDKVGTLTLTLKVKPTGGEEHTVFVIDDVKIAAPKPTVPAAIFYVDSDGNATRHNPRQARLPLREVPDDGTVTPKEARNA